MSNMLAHHNHKLALILQYYILLIDLLIKRLRFYSMCANIKYRYTAKNAG